MFERKNHLLTPVLLLFIIALSSCASVPVSKYQALKESSQSLLTNTTDTYTRIEKLQRRFVITSAPDSPINQDTFKPQIDGQSYDLVPELRYREAAFEVLVKYLTVLSVLSSKDYMADIDKASIDLSASIQTLMKKTKVVDSAHAPQVAGIFATLIDTISRPIIELKRIEALKSIMDSSQGDLEKLTGLLVGSNNKIETFVKKMNGTVIAHANLSRPPYQSAYRYEFDKDIAEQIQEIQEILASLDSISDGVAKIPKAHKEIRETLDKKPSNMEALKDLVQEAQSVNKFYRSLNSK
jgi:hypothetical protein